MHTKSEAHCDVFLIELFTRGKFAVEVAMIKSISRCLYMDRVGGERKMNCPNRKTRDETRPQGERYEPDKHEEEGGSAKGEGKSTSGQEGTLGGWYHRYRLINICVTNQRRLDSVKITQEEHGCASEKGKKAFYEIMGVGDPFTFLPCVL